MTGMKSRVRAEFWDPGSHLTWRLGITLNILSLCGFPLTSLTFPASSLYLSPTFLAGFPPGLPHFRTRGRHQAHCGRKKRSLLLKAGCALLSPGKFCQTHCLFLIYLSSSYNRERTDILNSSASESKSNACLWRRQGGKSTFVWRMVLMSPVMIDTSLQKQNAQATERSRVSPPGGSLMTFWKLPLPRGHTYYGQTPHKNKLVIHSLSFHTYSEVRLGCGLVTLAVGHVPEKGLQAAASPT